MKVLVVSDHATVPNMIKGAFREKNIPNAEIVTIGFSDDPSPHLGEDTIILVDWECEPDVGQAVVSKIKEAAPKQPVLLLCTKARAGTIFAGMKAGASGCINKPIDAEDLIKSVAQAVQKNQGSKPKVNVEFINPFIDATRNVFSTMCSLEIERKKLFLKDDHKMLGDVSGIMGLTGEATGSVVISMPERLACIVVGKMLGEEPADSLNQDVSDGVGEVINMVAGQAKAMLAQTKYHFTISIPSVISGQGHEITHKRGTPNLVVLFETMSMDFAIQVCLAPTES